jgi:two-component system, LytTR family, sensor histidine kinase AlgZ
MHPILFNRKRLLLYLAGWVLYPGALGDVFVIADLLNWEEVLAWLLPVGLINAFMGLGSWYLCRTLTFSKHAWLRQAVTLVLATVFSSILWILLGVGWAQILSLNVRFSTLPAKIQPLHPLMFTVGLLLFSLALALHYLIAAFEDSKAAEQRLLEMQLLARESELKALKAQLHPHFLFNSLNSVSALTGSNPAAARQMCLQLADFLRKSLAYAGMETITLAEEMDLAQNYLAIEKIRFGERLVVVTRFIGESKECQVLPLLLQPLLENAINHGISHLVEGGTILLEARKTENYLRLTLENPCDPDRPRKSRSGYGLALVKRRLEEYYGGQGWMSWEDQGSLFRVKIILPS